MRWQASRAAYASGEGETPGEWNVGDYAVRSLALMAAWRGTHEPYCSVPREEIRLQAGYNALALKRVHCVHDLCQQVHVVESQ